MEYPERVWEPTRDDAGNIKYPIRWASRDATAEDYLRRIKKTLQSWQKEIDWSKTSTKR